MTNLTIMIEIKKVCGKETIYPVCETAKLFAELANTKTLIPNAIRIIKKMGYEIQVKQQRFVA